MITETATEYRAQRLRRGSQEAIADALGSQRVATRLPLPSNGKLNARHRQMRGVWQIFAGNIYVNGASGDSPDIAAQELADQYDVAEGTLIVIHGFSEPSTMLTPKFNL